MKSVVEGNLGEKFHEQNVCVFQICASKHLPKDLLILMIMIAIIKIMVMVIKIMIINAIIKIMVMAILGRLVFNEE